MSGHCIRERERIKSLSLFCDGCPDVLGKCPCSPDRERFAQIGRFRARNVSLFALAGLLPSSRNVSFIALQRPCGAVSECVPVPSCSESVPLSRPASLSCAGLPRGRLGKCPRSLRDGVQWPSRKVSLFLPLSRASRNVSPLQRHFSAAHDRLAFRFSRVPATRRAAEKRKGHRANGGPFLTRSRREAGTRYRSKRNPTPAAIATQPGKRMSKHSRTPAAGRRRGRCSR